MFIHKGRSCVQSSCVLLINQLQIFNFDVTARLWSTLRTPLLLQRLSPWTCAKNCTTLLAVQTQFRTSNHSAATPASAQHSFKRVLHPNNLRPMQSRNESRDRSTRYLLRNTRTKVASKYPAIWNLPRISHHRLLSLRSWHALSRVLRASVLIK